MPRTESLSSLTNLQNNESIHNNYRNRLSPREIVGVHPRDAHIILNRVHQLIRESSDSNEDMYGGSKIRTYKN